MSGLRSEIVWKAEGVFLWVKLVVNDLDTGIEEDIENDEDLIARLCKLPEKIEDLYTAIFEKIPIDRLHGVINCLKVLMLGLYEGEGDLLFMSFVYEGPEATLRRSFKALSKAELKSRSDHFRAHLLSSSRHLIILDEAYVASPVEPGNHLSQNFKLVHDTLEEYIENGGPQWDSIIAKSHPSLIVDPYLSILSAHFCLIQTEELTSSHLSVQLASLSNVMELIEDSHMDLIDDEPEQSYEASIIEFMHNMSKQLSKAIPDWTRYFTPRIPLPIKEEKDKIYEENTHMMGRSCDYICVAVCGKWEAFLDEAFRQNKPSSEVKGHLLCHVMRESFSGLQSQLEWCLENGCHVNDMLGGKTAWEWFLQKGHFCLVSYMKACDTMLKHGADPNQIITDLDPAGTPLHAIIKSFDRGYVDGEREEIEPSALNYYKSRTKLFLEYEANLEAKDGAGNTVLEVARRWKRPEYLEEFQVIVLESVEYSSSRGAFRDKEHYEEFWEDFKYTENLEPLLLELQEEVRLEREAKNRVEELA